jgi:excisionase family DNA binding protein
MAHDSPFLAPEQVAERLAVSRLTVIKWLREGKLRGHKLGGKIWRVHPDDLQAFIEASIATRPQAKEDEAHDG